MTENILLIAQLTDLHICATGRLARISHRVLPTIGGLTLAMRRGRIGCVGVGT